MTSSRFAARRWTRWLLVLLILLAFTRLVWRLDGKDLWLDESFSLQRAESCWTDIFYGVIPVSDRVHTVQTIDQHPPVLFGLLGLAVHLLDKSEFVLRFPSVAAATLFVPICWALAWRLARRRCVPPAGIAPMVGCCRPLYLSPHAYDGLLPTSVWTPGIMIREYTTVLLPAATIPGENYPNLQMYDRKPCRSRRCGRPQAAKPSMATR